MRRWRQALSCVLVGGLGLPGLSALTIDRVEAGYRSAESLTYLPEYLLGREVVGRRTYLRTDPARRSGYYWVLDFDQSVRRLPSGTQVELQFFAPGQLEPSVRMLDLPARRGRGDQLWLGWTEAPGLDPDWRPLAWQVRLLDADGEVMAQFASFLWERP